MANERIARIDEGRTKLAGMGLSSTLLAGLTGALLMYYADPRSGRRRRAQLKDKATHAYKRSQDNLDMAARDLAHRAKGMAASRRHRQDEPVLDDKLEARVRSLLGRYCSHPHAVEVTAQGGEVELFGPILAHEHGPLLDGVRHVPGVRGVVDELHPYASGAHIPSLQGGRPRRGPRKDPLQDSWAPATRFLLGGLGAGIFLSSLRSHATGSKLVSLTGLGLFARAFTNKPIKRIVGVGAGRYAAELQKTLHIDAPLEEVYAFFEAPETWPSFMDHIEEIRRTGPNRWHWKVAGPGRVPFAWDAESCAVPNEQMSWQSLEGSIVQNAGVAHFEREGSGTRVHIQMTYNPPAGILGHNVAKALGVDPKKQMDEDLQRLKSLLEQGKATAHGHTVRREDIAVPSRGFSPSLPS